MNMRSHPILTRFLIWVVIPLILLFIYGYTFLLKSLPQKEGTIELTGLDSTVTVIRDEHAIPHIQADHDLDAFFALGYVHAQDRLWQMNFSIRLATGRLSEVLGRESLASDMMMRTLGMQRASHTALAHLDERTLNTLEAYSNGVNAWINEGHTLPPEFHLLGTTPLHWEPVNSLILVKLMAYTLGSVNGGNELLLSALIKELGVEKASELLPNVNQHKFPDSNAVASLDKGVVKELFAQHKQLQPQYNIGGEGLGSNAWAISGEYTKSGLPLLASDPHLGIEIPSLWYLANIEGDKINVSGATYPGAPIVLMGRNESIAWGTTNMLGDAQDLYVIRTNPLNEDQYEFDGQWLDMEVDEEVIYVKQSFPEFLTDAIPPVKWQVRRTRHGPLFSDAAGRAERPLALRWSGLDEQDNTLQSFLEINYATDWSSFKSAFEGYAAPALNFIYADKKGDIWLFAAGHLPFRPNSNGRLPVPGWQSKYEWDGYIPLDEMPQILNPEKGYVNNANNKNHAEDYPHLVANIWAAPYRYQRINEVLDGYIRSGQKVTAEEFIKLQGDVQSSQVQKLLPFLLKVRPETKSQTEALSQLKRWDGVVDSNSEEAVIFESWLRHFQILLIGDDLKGDALHEARGNQLQGVVRTIRAAFIDSVVYQNEDNRFDWCNQINTPGTESCEALALMALDSAIDEIERKIGKGEPWGDAHTKHFTHLAFTNIRILDTVFDREIEGVGDRYTVNSGNWNYSEDHGYRTITTANYRQVIDLGDDTQGGFINSTGQSGNVVSKHYDDNIHSFKQLKLWPMYLDPKRKATSTLTLVPSNSKSE